MLVVGGVPGKAFQASPWEAWLDASPFLEAGEPDRGIEIFEGTLAAYPGNPNVLYNLACFEALAGRADDALEHLAEAVEADPRTREWAQTDSDRRDPLGPALPGRLGGCVGGGELRPRDQLGLARRLEGRLGRPEGGAWTVSGEGAKLGSPEETVVAGVQ